MANRLFIEHYREFTITLEREALRFGVYEGQDPLEGDAQEVAAVDTWPGARVWVDTWHKRQVAEKKTVLDIPLQTPGGRQVIVTGIHMGTHALVGQGVKYERYGGYKANRLFPRSPIVVRLHKKLSRLEDEVEDLRQDLDKIIVDMSRGYGNVAHEKYDGLIEELQENVAKAAEALPALEEKHKDA